jgi:signal transduction histidine kinase
VSVASTLAKRYAAALENYLAGGAETALLEAYEVGRSALEDGLPPLVLFSVHRDVVQNLPPQTIEAGELVSMVTTVFVEALAPFQMADAGLAEARAALEALSASSPGGKLEIEAMRNELERIERTAETRRRLIADIVAAHEEERLRIAGEIHDDAVQAMTAVLLRLGMLADRLTEPDQLAVVEQLEANVSDSIARLRRLLVGLAPPELDRAGLAAAHRTTLEQLRAEFGLECELESRLAADPGPETRAIVFRIVQEAIANARKHARASRVNVLLESRDGGVVAHVNDDGVGFDVAESMEGVRPGHLGLPAMRERAELVGGWLRIESAPSGTSVSCWIPERRL